MKIIYALLILIMTGCASYKYKVVCYDKKMNETVTYYTNEWPKYVDGEPILKDAKKNNEEVWLPEYCVPQIEDAKE